MLYKNLYLQLKASNPDFNHSTALGRMNFRYLAATISPVQPLWQHGSRLNSSKAPTKQTEIIPFVIFHGIFKMTDPKVPLTKDCLNIGPYYEISGLNKVLN